MSDAGLQECLERMRDAGQSEVARDAFERAYRRLESGDQGLVHESDIEPLADLPELGDTEADDDALRHALDRVAVIKLNGGLGTSMGMTGPKSALPVIDDLSFLDVIVRQVLAARKRWGARLPLVLMDSFRTREASLHTLARYDGLASPGLPADFLQSAEPKVREDDLMPVDWPADRELEWCPPGHGDVYASLVASGTLAALREQGFTYAFISNADNLGATPDPRVAAWMVDNDVPFGMEACERTDQDRKGGHLAVRRSDGRLVLRDTAQTAPEDEAAMADITRHTTFNTNSLWISLDALDQRLADSGGVLDLPIIVNHKTVDPGDPDSTPVVQLESAMGAAVELFDGARAVLVGRERFRPVKTTNDLLLMRSDLYGLDDESVLQAQVARMPRIDLDPRFFKLIGDFDQRFPAGPPLLRAAESLAVEGDVTFGRDVVVAGAVTVRAEDGHPRRVPDAARLGR